MATEFNYYFLLFHLTAADTCVTFMTQEENFMSTADTVTRQAIEQAMAIQQEIDDLRDSSRQVRDRTAFLRGYSDGITHAQNVFAGRDCFCSVCKELAGVTNVTVP